VEYAVPAPRVLRLPAVRIAIALPLALATLALVAGPTAASIAGRRSYLVGHIQSARAAHGLRAYSERATLDQIAQNWARWMANHHSVQHNPSLSSQVHDWSALGENVGRASTVRRVHYLFMHSAPHRANILSRTFGRVGVGSARGTDGRVYVDEVFKRAE
jgi:uncharacterized protein YkwD